MTAFPALGFPDETVAPDGSADVYTCKPTPGTIVIVWRWGAGRYGLNLYVDPPPRGAHPTSSANRIARFQEPLEADDPFEVMCLIYHLIQTHLPSEVTT